LSPITQLRRKPNGHRAEIEGHIRRRQSRNIDIAFVFAQRRVMAMDVLNRIQRHISSEHKEQSLLWLKGMNKAALAHELGKCNRVRPDIRSDVNDAVARPNELPRKLDFKVAPFAIDIERPTDTGVIAVVYENAATTPLDGDMTMLK
jgi:hypothetical protein